MMAGGGYSVGKALGVQGTGPRSGRYNYGGSPTATDAYRHQYASGLADAQGQAATGTGGLAGIGSWGAGQAYQRGNDVNAALDMGYGARRQQEQQAGAIAAAANGYQPGAQSAAAMNLALQRNAAAGAALARSGGNEAMAMRNAVAGNAQAGVDASANIAMLRAQEEQAAVQMRMQGAQAAADAYGQIRGGDSALAGMQAQREQFGAQTAGSAYSGLASIGAGREGNYLDSQQSLEQAQLQAQMEYDRQRQANQQQKRSMLFGLGAGLIGAGGNVMASGMGGGGGYGGGAAAAGGGKKP